MKKFISMLCLTLILVGSQALRAQGNAQAIVGEWLNEKQDAKFLIYQAGGKFFGKITWGTSGDSKDSKNPNPALRNRDVIGLILLSDFSFAGKNVWDKGSIYDPREGKTYSCKLTLSSPERLEVRGFVGIPMFGRTETWTKTN
jgi:uncharacterized protein (DUF2147 family)